MMNIGFTLLNTTEIFCILPEIAIHYKKKNNCCDTLQGNSRLWLWAPLAVTKAGPRGLIQDLFIKAPPKPTDHAHTIMTSLKAIIDNL